MMADEKPALYPFDFRQIWIDSVKADRYEAQMYRRRAKLNRSVGSSDENVLWLATRSYRRALHGIAMVRLYTSKETTDAPR
jgi:hypothetical protein